MGVNTGRYVGNPNFEDTVLKINLEAVREIICQLRLRNIGNIIVIDFIDMAHEKSQKVVHEALVTALEGDKVRTRILPMSALGLVEMTRKRVRESLPRSLAEPCRRCDGRGWTLTAHEIARQVVARIRDTLSTKRDLLKRVDIEAQTPVGAPYAPGAPRPSGASTARFSKASSAASAWRSASTPARAWTSSASR
ncbi:MAG: ribonuclease E/G [Myxococcales bacterium]|nr:ribonuclease E/G [Myxococcales bacterium]